MRSDSEPRPGLDGSSVTAASAPPAGDSNRDVSARNVASQGNIGGAATLGPSGSDSDVSSLALSPTVTAVKHDETEYVWGSWSAYYRCVELISSLFRSNNVQGGTGTHELPVTVAQNQDSNVGVPIVNVASSRVDEVCELSFASEDILDNPCDLRRTYHQGEGTELPSDRDSDEVSTPTTPTAVLEPERAQSPSTDPLSFHCRSCFADPCVKPVATLCGHIFCHRYDSMRRRLCQGELRN